jgi:hypothetical protein
MCEAALDVVFRRRPRRIATYFFFFLLVFFAAFFAAAFDFFAFFAIAALLAMWDGDVRTVQSRIELHCISITQQHRKKKRFRLRKCVRGRCGDARCAMMQAWTRIAHASSPFIARRRRQTAPPFKNAYSIWLFAHPDFLTCISRARALMTSHPSFVRCE